MVCRHAAILRLGGLAILALLLARQVPAQDEEERANGGFVGAKVCGSCHSEEYEKQSRSAHARSLHRAPDHPLAAAFPSSGVKNRAPDFRFQLTRADDELRIRASQKGQFVELPLDWAFGAGDHAVTFVSQIDEGVYLEHYLSYFAKAGSLDVTPGHEDGTAATLTEAIGVPFETFDPNQDILRCFGCHATGPLSLGPRYDIQPSELGVRCEVCHGPGRRHVEAVGAGQVEQARKLINNPGRFNGPEQIEFCGSCHRKPPAKDQTFTWDNPWFTRHQPMYLSQSTCFKESNGALSCTTCHDPHSPVRRDASLFYAGLCIECHQSGSHPEVEAASLDDCAGCHMPAVSPRPYIQFANHWIGIYENGETLKPSR